MKEFHSRLLLGLGNCDIHVKWKIFFTNEMKLSEISLKLKAKDQEIYWLNIMNFC